MATAGKKQVGVNYSKWDNIELSDDEADVHPNIDKASWFRMKHTQRVEREAEEDKEKKALAAVRATFLIGRAAILRHGWMAAKHA